MRKDWILGAVVLVGACASTRPPASTEVQPIPDAAAIDSRVAQVMARTGADGARPRGSHMSGRCFCARTRPSRM